MIANMNKIIDGLYLGNFDAANDHLTLKRHGITHILTVAAGLYPARADVSENLRNNSCIGFQLETYSHTRYA
jgi:hypothetical protein